MSSQGLCAAAASLRESQHPRDRVGIRCNRATFGSSLADSLQPVGMSTVGAAISAQATHPRLISLHRMLRGCALQTHNQHTCSNKWLPRWNRLRGTSRLRCATTNAPVVTSAHHLNSMLWKQTIEPDIATHPRSIQQLAYLANVRDEGCVLVFAYAPNTHAPTTPLAHTSRLAGSDTMQGSTNPPRCSCARPCRVVRHTAVGRKDKPKGDQPNLCTWSLMCGCIALAVHCAWVCR